MTDLHTETIGKEVEVTEADILETDCDFAATAFRALSSGQKMEEVCYACLAKWTVRDGKVFFNGTCLSWHRGALPRE